MDNKNTAKTAAKENKVIIATTDAHMQAAQDATNRQNAVYDKQAQDAQDAQTKPFIDNSSLDLRKPTAATTAPTAAPTAATTAAAPKTKTRKKNTAKPAAKENKGFATHSLIDWCKKAYSLTTLDRANGTVYHINLNGAHKKLIKTANFENKMGVFFGGMLNSVLSSLATSGQNYLTVLHSKSNVYKIVRPTLSYAQIITVQKQIVKICGTPKIAVGQGYNIDQK